MKSLNIDIKGYIVENDDKCVYDWIGYDAVCPADINKLLSEANGQPVNVKINSRGGSTWAGSEIYTSLKSYNGLVNIEIYSIAASAASVIAMAGRCSMSPTAQMMIHNVSTYADGDYREMEHSAEILKTADKSVASAYCLKSGMSEDMVLELMNKETWLSAQEALDLKLIDEVMFTGDTVDNIVKNMYNSMPILNRSAISKIKELRNIKSNPQNRADFFVEKKMQAQLNLYKLGGKLI